MQSPWPWLLLPLLLPLPLLPELVVELMRRPWLGNVRELRNFVERATVLGPRAALSALAPDVDPSAAPVASVTPNSPPLPGAPDIAFEGDYRGFRDRWNDWGEREYLRRLLERHGGNVTQAAVEAAVDRTYVHRLMRRQGL